MKYVRRIFAIALTLVMALAVALPAFAASGDRTVDDKVSVSGLETGDTVKAYKFISWVDGDGWEIAEGITGITLNDMTTDGLTKEKLAALASETNIAKMTPVSGTIENGTWEMTCGETTKAGSYLILVTSGEGVTYVYNPVVVSADFDGTNSAAVDLTDKTAKIKRQDITIEKEADNPDDYDVQAGDIVPFTVTVTVPQYNTNWTEPYFAVSDTLSNGLTIETAPTIAGLTAGTDYTLTVAEDNDGFTIIFSEDYLKNNPSKAVEIKYTALVGDAVKANAQVHEETNNVTLEFSNNPSNSSDHKTLEDETHHYTFSIDGNRYGQDSEKTNELIKVGVDADGNPITIYKEGTAFPSGVKALAGAEFTLTGVGANNTGTVTLNATSDANGRIFFNNLEAGTYTLKETKAPNGYIKDSTEHTVVITAEYNEEDNNTLKSYSIKIDGESIATYTATTNAEEVTTYEATPNGNNSFPVNNKQGTELPSTGGIGTTIFYIVGGVMVAGAAIFLLTKRRVTAE